jgi:predicted Zn-dependent protease
MKKDVPKRSADLVRRAQEALARHQFAREEALLLRLIELEPDEPLHAARLVCVYGLRGQHALAIAFAQRAVALDPEDPQLARILGSALEAGGEPDLARAAYLAAVAVGANPRHPQPWLGLARLERGQGRLTTAEQYARRAIEAAPHSAEGYAELSRVLLAAGGADWALAALAIGLRRAPGDPDLIALRDAALATAPDGRAVDRAGDGVVPTVADEREARPAPS